MDWRLLLETYGYFAFYLFLIIEGQPVYWLGGVLLALGGFNLWPLLIGPLFILLGDYLFYLLGCKLGARAVDKFGKYIGLTHRRVDYLSSFFKKHKGKAIIVGKLTYGIGHNLMLVFGITRGKFKEVWKWSLLASTISYFLYVSLGYFLGEGYVYVKNFLQEYSILILLAVVFTIFGIQVIVRRIKEEKFFIQRPFFKKLINYHKFKNEDI